MIATRVLSQGYILVGDKICALIHEQIFWRFTLSHVTGQQNNVKTNLYLSGVQLQVASFTQDRDQSVSLQPWVLVTSMLLYSHLQKPRTLAWLRTEDLAHTICGDTGACRVDQRRSF